MKVKRAKGRRGVLLLVILGLLAMFALVAVVFVAVTSRALLGAKMIQRVDEYPKWPHDELNAGIIQVLSGSLNRGSALRNHSLLEDLYGYDPRRPYSTLNDPVTGNPSNGVLSGLGTVCGGQLFEFNLPDPYLYAGCVLTMLDGNAKGQSTIIVGVSPAMKPLALAFEVGTPANGDKFLVSGAPFSGTGFGYSPGSPLLDAPSTGGSLLALSPGAQQNGGVIPYDYALGGANEDYDAVDFQNMLLAAVIHDPSGDLGLGPFGSAGPTVQVIPSLHRPALVAIMGATHETCLRPLRAPNYHPDFTGSNSRFNATWDGKFVDVNPPDGICDFAWDVDNDGDGVADSVWVDLGMPARASADGRLYKPLFAILCVDMDGRLNLNAHGHWQQVQGRMQPAYYSAQADASTELLPGALFGGSRVGQTVAQASLPRGIGTGPAEISLVPVFCDPSTGAYAYNLQLQQLLGGRYSGGGSPMPGWDGVDDPLSQNKSFEYQGNYWGFVADGYGSPPDMSGTAAIGLDVGGCPNYLSMGQNPTDDPYEMDFAKNTTRGLTSGMTADNAFSLAEFERLLRPFDRDARNLPGRLAYLTNGGSGTSVLHKWRNSVTVESRSIPCASVALPEQLRSNLQGPGMQPRVPGCMRPLHVTDLLRAKGAPPNVWAQLMAPELLAGLRMDLNRPFGNGRDNSGDDSVDDPAESTGGDQIDVFDLPGNQVPVPVDHDNDGAPGSTPENMGRLLHARYLYVLMLALMDDQYPAPDWDPAKPASQERARWAAQWAANVVDFRDRDSIMTGFEYDIDPFDGWNVDDNLSTDEGALIRGVVWGCERPELVIGETLAFHDRRTKDTKDENAGSGELTTDNPPDTDFDQKYMPEGSLFVELYNPWSDLEPQTGDLCNAVNPAAGGVELDASKGGSPAWRLIIVDRTDADKDPDDPDQSAWPTIERTVYFVAQGAALPGGGGGTVNFQRDGGAAPLAPILPGRYCVIGPGKPQAGGKSYIGWKAGATNGDNSTRRIELHPNGNPNAQQVEVYSDGNSDDLAGVSIQPAVAVVIDHPRRLSISEPDGGYPPPDDPANGEYNDPPDVPLDANSPLANEIMNSGKTDEVKWVHLQRLANPLKQYNPDTNPYRTIDGMAIDLTSFNGVESRTVPDPSDTGSPTDLLTRERGENNAPAGTHNIWADEPQGTSPRRQSSSTPVSATNHNYNNALHHTLGYLNDPFGTPQNLAGRYLGDQEPSPFPWLNWNNRPYVSQLELLLVPPHRSSMLLKWHDVVRAAADPYDTYEDPFAHDRGTVRASSWANFFHSDTPGNSLQIHRVLEYLQVPSRYVGTEIQVHPNLAVGGINHRFNPPFQRISRRRDPGRINLNTIFSKAVFDGLMNDPSVPGRAKWYPQITWADFVASRRGYPNPPVVPSSILDLDPSFPTRFGNPFRSFAGGDMVPLLNMKPSHGAPPTSCEVNATVLREEPAGSNDPLFHVDSTHDYNDTDRNPYFRYQAIHRLGNLATTRSNVYAVWITVGYFEVSPAASGYNQSIFPDGYMLGRELGSDTGDIERHRAFYMIDRSIPVGFDRGKDLNCEKAILVKRYIE